MEPATPSVATTILVPAARGVDPLADKIVTRMWGMPAPSSSTSAPRHSLWVQRNDAFDVVSLIASPIAVRSRACRGHGPKNAFRCRRGMQLRNIPLRSQ